MNMLCSVFISVVYLLIITDPIHSATTKDPPVYQLPSYIKRACSRNDPNINTCVVEVGAPAIKTVAKGDPKYRIPVLDPLTVTELKIQEGTKQVGLQLVCKDCKLWGLQNIVFTKADVNWKDRKCQWDFTLDKLKVTGKYNVTGQVLLLPIVGNGDAEINLEDMKFSYIYDWTYEKKKNGYTYVIIGNSSLPFDVGKMTIKLENLFNGDPLLGGNMNRFLNEHWQEILKDLKPALSKAVSDLATNILTNMARLVPFDIMFPDT
ncbi:hypothetical protein O3M35_010616 [Rhynocoris fuscipes]|uniref:Uncharacterized protein n=1 Tax=Rhynocoris fuscipes TaxID=488301 RepID=A0AAW1D0K8_9HEMI